MHRFPRRFPRPRSVAVAAVVAASVTLGACGGEDDDDAPGEVVGMARVTEAPPVVKIEMRTVNKSVPLNALRPAATEPAPATGSGPAPEPDAATAPDGAPDSAVADVAGTDGDEATPAATVATSIEKVVIAPDEAADVAADLNPRAGADVAAPIEADDLIAKTNVTTSVPDATSDNPPWNRLVSDWTGSVKLLRERFGDLGEDELLQTRGNRDQVLSIMEQRMGVPRNDAGKQLDEFVQSGGS